LSVINIEELPEFEFSRWSEPNPVEGLSRGLYYLFEQAAGFSKLGDQRGKSKVVRGHANADGSSYRNGRADRELPESR